MEIRSKKECEKDKLFHELNEVISYHMKEMQNCLMTAGKLFYDYDQDISEKKSGKEVVESAIVKECVVCKEKRKCRFTMEEKDQLGVCLERYGRLRSDDFRNFRSCKREKEFIQEINRIYERELFHLSMEQGLIQMRRLIGKQYLEAGNMLGGFAGGQFEMSKGNKELKQSIKKQFKEQHLEVKEIYFYDNLEKGKQIYLFVKRRRSSEISVKQTALILSETLKKKMQPLPGQKKMIGSGYEMLGFVQAPRFHVLGGVISKPCRDGDKNGDSFSMKNIGEKRFISIISDGMGTGDNASRESRKNIETLEELLEAGISETKAITLLHSLFLLQPEKEQYATIDYLQIDLFAGIGTSLKIGACPSFLKRKGKVEILPSETLPIAYKDDKAIPFCRKKLESEDMILQVSDGVLDSIEGDGIEKICEYMEEIQAIRPQTFVEQLMEKLQETKGFEKRDDMTMIALGIWDKY
ncbi:MULTISPECIES: SpoIIE family protein phosphatase [Anaerostipes]|uniref:SpoIIE family protein phosphatase n=1 Tax=Anaerostipes TaxID=207244 RepID=UPI0009523AB2|nr:MULTISPECIES: SpoIIE family protein phosphatase [Anaerostipes]MCI5623311.1 SpoIIE family protein phosphatase [Anaerostipes sp.]MDY2726410.1 SpoIIE family protein phosphatase [Anaerostipes faecalis]OLR59851.1 stage II sporulation protein E [Anaerostipes sp. 494a]